MYYNLLATTAKTKFFNMTNSLYNKLQIYYGELLHELQKSYDYFEKRKLQEKLKAIELLLNINKL